MYKNSKSLKNFKKYSAQVKIMTKLITPFRSCRNTPACYFIQKLSNMAHVFCQIIFKAKNEEYCLLKNKWSCDKSGEKCPPCPGKPSKTCPYY